MRRARALLVLAAALGACGGDASDAPRDGGPDATASDAAGADDGTAPTPDGAAMDRDSGPADGAPSSPADAPDAPPPPLGPCGTPLPTDQHYVPPGLCAGVVARLGSGLRSICFAPNGDLFAVATIGSIRRLHDANGDGVFDDGEITVYGTTGGSGHDCHVDAAGGYLYAGSPGGVRRWPWDASRATGGAGEDVVVNQPSSGHNLHSVHVWGGFLYVHSGSAGNAVDPMSPAYDTDRSLLRRFDLSRFTPGAPFDWTAGENVTLGLRNMEAYARSSLTGRIFGAVNGFDDLHYAGNDVHQDNPGEQIVEILSGRSYGYPFCFTAARIVDGSGQLVPPGKMLWNPDFGVHDDAWCAANASPAASFLQAHSAPLDMVFFDDQPAGALPERWRGGAFIASHGSWDRDVATGYKVVWLPFDATGAPPMPTATATGVAYPYETVLGGGDASAPADGPWRWMAGTDGEEPRPVGVAVSPKDGALYVSSDNKGYVYRVAVAR